MQLYSRHSSTCTVNCLLPSCLLAILLLLLITAIHPRRRCWVMDLRLEWFALSKTHRILDEGRVQLTSFSRRPLHSSVITTIIIGTSFGASIKTRQSSSSSSISCCSSVPDIAYAIRSTKRELFCPPIILHFFIFLHLESKSNPSDPSIDRHHSFVRSFACPSISPDQTRKTDSHSFKCPFAGTCGRSCPSRCIHSIECQMMDRRRRSNSSSGAPWKQRRAAARSPKENAATGGWSMAGWADWMTGWLTD